MKTEIYRKIYINRDPKELPKNEGHFIVFNRIKYKEELAGQGFPYIKHFDTEYKDYWLELIDWYLAPVRREEIIEIVKNKIEGLSTKEYIAEQIADEITGGVK